MLWYVIGFAGIVVAVVAYALKGEEAVLVPGEADAPPDWEANPNVSLSASLRERFARF